MRKNLRKILVLFLCMAFLCGCASQEAKGVTEDFCAVVEDFSPRYQLMDLDGQMYENVLDIAENYVDGQLTADRALELLHDTQDFMKKCEDELGEEKVGEELEESLSACRISPQEYEMFMNVRRTTLHELNSQIAVIENYLAMAERLPAIREELEFLIQTDRELQEIEKEYCYYANLNYWFYTADEEQYNYIREEVISQLGCYVPESAGWYEDEEELTRKINETIDQMNEILTLYSKRIGEIQEKIYELEKEEK